MSNSTENKPFEWTEKRALQLINFIGNYEHGWPPQRTILEQFKSSHSVDDKGRDWEIRSFKLNNFPTLLIEKDSNGRFNGYTEDAFLNDPCNSVVSKSAFIYSVLRKGDGEIFSVGDRLNKYDADIKYFEVVNGALRIISDAKGKGCSTDKLSWTIDDLTKAPVAETKPVLFKSFDEINIYEGDKYWCLQSEWFISECTTKDYRPDCEIKRFSSRGAAEEYITLNKPCLSVNDVKSVYSDGRSFVGTEFLIDGLKNLVQSKIKQ